MKSTFWSEDYITGITFVLHSISNESLRLKTTLKLISDFDEKVTAPAIRSLADIAKANEVRDSNESLWDKHQRQHIELLNTIAERLGIASHSKLEEACLAPLEALQFEYEEFYRESESILNSNYGHYSKCLSQAKKSQLDYFSRNDSLKQLYLVPMENNSDHDSDENEIEIERLVCTDSGLKFHYTLDKRLMFKSEDELEEFVNTIKDTTVTSRRLIPLPGVNNDYFSCDALFEAIKRVASRLDTSVFNKERIGQSLIDSKIISPYNDVLGAKPVFTSQGYYVWAYERNRKEAHSNETQPAKADGFSGFLRKISGVENSETKITTPVQLLEEQKSLKRLRDVYFDQCQALDYARLQLEVELQKCMAQYESMLNRGFQVVHHVSTQFRLLCSNSMSISTVIEPIDVKKEVEKVYEANHGTVGYYVPQPGVTFVEYDSRGILIAESMFHADLVGAPAAERGAAQVLDVLLKYLRELDSKLVLQAWGTPLDFVRVSNFRRECIAEFSNNRGDHKYSMLNALTRQNRPVADVVGLLRMWLLELPDAVIPMACYEPLCVQDTASALGKAPKEHLANLAALCDHFQWLTRECGTESLANLFFAPADIPLYHLFARNRLRQPLDAVIMSPVVYKILCHERSPKMLETLIGAAHAGKEALGPPVVIARDPLLTPVRSARHLQPNSTFVPRPLKTVSAEASPHRSPSRSRKRISGINLGVQSLASSPGPEENSSELASPEPTPSKMTSTTLNAPSHHTS